MTALTDVTEDLAVAALAGYLATKAMEPVSMRLYELESEKDRQREDAVRPGPPYEIAAKKVAASLGVELHGVALERASLAMHYGLALSWSPLYGVLRRTRDVHPFLAGLGTGAAMSLVADEAMTPLLGYSAPNRLPARHPTCGASSRTWCSGSPSQPPPRPPGPCADGVHERRRNPTTPSNLTLI